MPRPTARSGRSRRRAPSCARRGMAAAARTWRAGRPPSAGRTSVELSVLDLDRNQFGPEIRSQLGVVPQSDNLDMELRVRDNLIVYGRYFGLPIARVKARADQLLAFAQLEDKARSKVDDLSGG